MNLQPRTPEATYALALDKAQKDLAALDPRRVAHCAGVTFEGTGGARGDFTIPFFGTTHLVSWPDAQVQRAAPAPVPDIASRILLLHYLVTADGTPLQDRWIAFRNLPGGLGYDAAFRQRTSTRLSHTFGRAKPDFEATAQTLGGERLSFGDSAFSFRLLPRVWAAVVLFLEDDELPADANVLFDGASSHYLPTEDLAVLGGMLAGRLAKARLSGIP